MWFRYTATFTSSQNIIVRLSLDGGISVYRGAGDGPETLLGSSASKPFVFSTLGSNVWNYMEVKCLFHATNGSVEVRFAPPGGPMAVILSLTGIKTCAASDAPFTNEVSPRAAAGITKDCYFADYYCLDWSTPPNDDYLGGVRIYHNMPVDNGTVQWIPLANQNWQEVNEVPPDGDTSYNSADTVGLSDQYQHVIGGVPVASNIFGVQHVMDLTLGSGSRAITSSVNGTPDPSSVYLSNGYSMYTWPYDVNPVSGLPWAVSAFPVFFGPEVTA
jgi:hypothetical protein